MQLSARQNQVHQNALYLANRHHALEAKLVETLREVERLRIHRQFGMSLFKYATEILKLSEGFTYSLITVARKSNEIPQLRIAIQNKTLSLSKASRIVANLTSENASEWIEFAEGHNRREIDFEMAKRNPRLGTIDKVKELNEEDVEIKITIKRSTFEKLKRAESLEAQKQQSTKWGDVLESVLETYLDKNDPVRKAERALDRKLWRARVKDDLYRVDGERIDTSKNFLEESAQEMQDPVATREHYKTRIPLTAEQKHAVFLRDKGRCTNKDLKGHICGSDRWTEIHHIVSVAEGGTNDLENLTTLCSLHHDLVHQLSLPIDGQVNWLRSPMAKYG